MVVVETVLVVVVPDVEEDVGELEVQDLHLVAMVVSQGVHYVHRPVGMDVKDAVAHAMEHVIQHVQLYV